MRAVHLLHIKYDRVFQCSIALCVTLFNKNIVIIKVCWHTCRVTSIECLLDVLLITNRDVVKIGKILILIS